MFELDVMLKLFYHEVSIIWFKKLPLSADNTFGV